MARQFQETLGSSMQKMVAPSVLMQGLPHANDALPAFQFDPAKLLEIQQTYIQEASSLWNQGLSPEAAPVAASTDRRFAAEAWHANPLAHFSASSYMLNSQALMGMAEAVEGDEKTKARVRLAVEQWLAAAAPSNFLALNAEAQKKAIDTQGESIAQGLQNLMHDMRQGHVSMTDESIFEVGKNVATTEGAVVYENAYFQLLEYKSLTAKVFESLCCWCHLASISFTSWTCSQQTH
jgi:polyhydroxyalkanoate synthase